MSVVGIAGSVQGVVASGSVSGAVNSRGSVNGGIATGASIGGTVTSTARITADGIKEIATVIGEVKPRFSIAGKVVMPASAIVNKYVPVMYISCILDNGAVTALSATYDEILEAYNTGVIIMLQVFLNGVDITAPLVQTLNGAFIFMAPYESGDSTGIASLSITREEIYTSIRAKADLVNGKVPVSQLPDKVSTFENDAGYLTEHQDLSEYAKSKDIPKNVSELSNDAGYLTEHQDLSEYAKSKDIPKNVSELNNDAGYLTEHQDLSEYAKSKDIPKNVSELNNDKQYLINETDPTVPAWAKTENKPVYNANEVGADAQGTALSLVSSHNTDTDAHNDIRLLIQALIARLDAVANSSDEELDQLSEIVEYIKSNKSLIDSITTSKVNVIDIVDNLTTNVSNKPLSAAQGVALKALFDAIIIPTKVSQLENDEGYLKHHQDLSEYAKASAIPTKISQLSQDDTHRVVTDAEKAAWNAKSNFSGKYDDLSGKPTIPAMPTKVSQLSNDSQFVSKSEVEAMFATFANDYLGGYKLRVADANDAGKSGYITVKKG